MTSNQDRLTAGSVQPPHSNVSVYQAIFQRRMSAGFTSQAVSKEILQKVLDAAIWSPNHKLTEPWRFIVLPKGGRTRTALAEQMYQFTMERGGPAQRAEAAKAQIAEPPVLLFVYCITGVTEELTRENYAATVIAAYNISLTCQAEGLGVKWETGGPTRYPGMAAIVGADPTWLYPNMLSIGYPTHSLASHRTPATRFVTWKD